MKYVLLSAVIALSACDQVQEATDNVARTGARAAIDEVLVTRFPNVDGAQVTLIQIV